MRTIWMSPLCRDKSLFVRMILTLPTVTQLGGLLISILEALLLVSQFVRNVGQPPCFQKIPQVCLVRVPTYHCRIRTGYRWKTCVVAELVCNFVLSKQLRSLLKTYHFITSEAEIVFWLASELSTLLVQKRLHKKKFTASPSLRYDRLDVLISSVFGFWFRQVSDFLSNSE